MNQVSGCEEYRALILRCKRPELDKLIKLTNLPRGGLKQDLQLRLLSYLEQNPSNAFLTALSDLLLHQRHTFNNQVNGNMVSNPTCGENMWPQDYREWEPLSHNQTRDPMRSSSSTGCFPSQQNLFGIRSSWPPRTEASTTPRSGNSTGVESPPVSSHPQNSQSLSGPTLSHDQTGCAITVVSSSSEVGSAKSLTYQLQPGPIGPLIGLAGVKGSFRLPACVPGFRFRESPFFKEIDVLLPPQIMTPNHIGFATGRRSYDRSLALRFTPDQAETITYHCRRLPDERMEFGVQVIMRFARLDPAMCTQLVEAHGLNNTRGSRADPAIQPKPLTLSEDSLPVHLAVQVNGRSVQLPPLLPSNRPGMDGRRNPRPINITQFLRVSPAISNYIKLTWTHDYASYVYSMVGVYLMHKRSPQQLCTLLQSTAFQSAETMKAELIRKLQTGRSKSNKVQKPQSTETADDEEDDDLVMPNTLPVQLLCPLSKCRIDVPVRGRECRHIQCYDATTYLIINERKPAWNCPVCDRKVYYEDLIIDGLFLEVLNSKTAQDLDEAVFHDDGTWSVLEESARPKPTSSADSSSNDTPATGQNCSSGLQQVNCLNSPANTGSIATGLGAPVQQRTPNSSVSVPEPDSVGSSTMSAGLSFGAVSPAGSASSGPPFNLVPPGSPIRGTSGYMAGSTPFRTPHVSPHPVGSERDPDRSIVGQSITIDLTASDDEADKSQRSGVVGNRSGSTIVLSDDDLNPLNSPTHRPPSVGGINNMRTTVARPPPIFAPHPVTTSPASHSGETNAPPSSRSQNRPFPCSPHPNPTSQPASSLTGTLPLSIVSVTSGISQSHPPSRWLSKQSSCSTAEGLSTTVSISANNASAAPAQTTVTVSAQNRKRTSELASRNQTPTDHDSARPFDAKQSKSNGFVASTNRSYPLTDSQTHSSKNTCPADVHPTASTPLIPYSTAQMDSAAAYPDFRNPYESFSSMGNINVDSDPGRPYVPDPYHYYRNPAVASNNRSSDGFSPLGMPQNSNPYHYRSQPAPTTPSHCSPFDTTHYRRFRNGSPSPLDRQLRRAYETIPPVRPDQPTQTAPSSSAPSYPTADDIYARFLSDCTFQPSRSSSQAPVLSGPMDQYSPSVDPLSPWLQFQENRQHMH